MQYVSTRAAGGYRMRTYSERPPEVRLVVQRGDGRARVVRLRSRSRQNARSTQAHTRPTAPLGTQRCATDYSLRSPALHCTALHECRCLLEAHKAEAARLVGRSVEHDVRLHNRPCGHARTNVVWLHGVCHTATYLVLYVLRLGRTQRSLAEYRTSTARGDVARKSFASRGYAVQSGPER